MSTQFRERRASFVSLSLLVLLILVGLIALVEKGPSVPGIPLGASPLNPLALGTYRFAELASRKYQAVIATSINDLLTVSSTHCIYISISPETPYTVDEAKQVIEVLKQRCGEVTVLVADEAGYANPLLKAVNSSIMVVGDRIAVTTPQKTLSLYPLATISVDGKAYVLRLDKASSIALLSKNPRVVGYANAQGGSTLCLLRDSTCYRYVPVAPVAAEEVTGVARVFVIGDGSVFLNQVLESNATVYRDFASALLDYLCGEGECTVVFDGMHYTTLSIADLSNPQTSVSVVEALVKDPTALVFFALSYVALLLHPSTWLPPLAKWAGNAIESLKEVYAYLVIAVLILTPMIYNLVVDEYRRLGGRITADSRLGEQIEEEVGVFAELKKAVASGKLRLGKEDFKALYSSLNTLVKLYSGHSLEDPEAVDVLAELLGDRDRVVKELKWLMKMRKKVAGESITPIVLSWSRAVKRVTRLVDEVAKAVGSRVGVNIA
jgi:hypothetical protein